METPAQAQPTIVPRSMLLPPKSNHRDKMNEAALQELAQSMRAQGILQPLLVRPVKGGKMEVVAGARRLAAAEIAGLDDVPVSICAMTDEEALAAAMVENLQREAITALDEGEGFTRLAKKKSVGEIAESIGRSKRYVWDRVKLAADLHPEAKKLLLEGKLPTSHAILLRRLYRPRQPSAPPASWLHRGLPSALDASRLGACASTDRTPPGQARRQG